MAILTDAQLVAARHGCARDVATVRWTKAQFKAAIQAIEDEYQATCKLALATAVEIAVPGVFTNADKKALGRWWAAYRFGVDV